MYRVASLVLLVVSTFLLIQFANSAAVNNQSDQCADILMLFARGSSSNPSGLNSDRPFSEDFMNGVDDPQNPGKKIGAEEIPGSFFRWMEKRIKADYPHIDYKAISVHYSGKGYSQNGYPAVGIFNPDTIGNMLQAEFTWWKAGEYTDSVTSGSQELAGYVRDASINCPNQRIIVGGYSQGAQVVHEALKIIPEGERNLIDNVVLFGDPKFIGADYNKYNLLDKPKAYPWHRGTAGLRERGLGDAQIPYVPQDMWYKTISWCHEDDFVCTGLSGLSWAITNHEMPGNDHSIWSGPTGAFGDGHTRYPVFGVPESTAEVMENLKTHLTSLEKARGGLDPKVNPYQKVYDSSLINDRPVDLMFALNYTAGNEDAQAQYFLKLKDITKQYKKNFTAMKTGGLVYTDLAGNIYQPNSSYISAYARQPNQLNTDMDTAFAGNVYFSGGPGGGGDYPENHGMLIERGGMFAGWRSNATKHLVIFAERPAQEAYSYKLCYSSVYSAFPYSGPNPCVEGTQFQTSTQPQMCESILVVMSSSTCPYVGPTGYTKVISRSLSDAVTLARAKGFVVDIVQPHTARNTQPAPYTPQYVENQLKTLAESTGGLYLKYDVFDEPAMRDAVWQILNHQPKILNVSQYAPGSLLNFDNGKLLPDLQLASLRSNTDSNQLITTTPISGAQSYGWDFDGNGSVDEYSSGPAVEHAYTSPPSIAVITAYATPNGQNPITTKVIPIQQSTATSSLYFPISLDGLSGLTATRTDGLSSTTIIWDVPSNAGQFGVVVIRDPATGVILYSAPVKSGAVTLETTISPLNIQYIDHGAESEPQSIEVTITYPPPPDPEVITPIQDPIPSAEPDPPTSQDPPIEVVDESPPEELPADDIPPQEEVVVIDDPSDEAVIVDDQPPPSEEETPPPDEEDPGVPSEQQNEPDPLVSVGQDRDKIVTQDEPNTTENPNSPAINNTPDEPMITPPPIVQYASVVRVPTYTASIQPAGQGPSPTVTAVAGEQSANPDGPNPENIGGLREANQLFPDENIGQNPVKQKSIWPYILAVAGVIIIAFLIALIVLKKKNQDEDEHEE